MLEIPFERLNFLRILYVFKRQEEKKGLMIYPVLLWQQCSKKSELGQRLCSIYLSGISEGWRVHHHWLLLLLSGHFYLHIFHVTWRFSATKVYYIEKNHSTGGKVPEAPALHDTIIWNRGLYHQLIQLTYVLFRTKQAF